MEENQKKCSYCGSPLKTNGQRGFGSAEPKPKCTNPACQTNKPASGWCK